MGVITVIMASRQSSEDENRLFDTIHDRIVPAEENPIRAAIKETAAVLSTTAIGMTMLASPAAAQTTELGNSLCGSGAGWVVTALGILAAVYLVGSGGFGLIGALDDAGSVKDEKRDKARQEAKGAALSIGGGLVGVPFIGAFLGQVLPESFSCIGFELNFLIVAALPF